MRSGVLSSPSSGRWAGCLGANVRDLELEVLNPVPEGAGTSMQCLSPLMTCPGGREPAQCAFSRDRRRLRPGCVEQKRQGLELEKPKKGFGSWLEEGREALRTKHTATPALPPGPGAWETQLEAAAGQQGPAPARGRRRLGPRGRSCQLPGGDRGGNIRSRAGASPVGLAPKPKSLPLLPRLSQGRNSGEGTPSSSPVSVFGEEPWDRGSRRPADEERRDARSPMKARGRGFLGLSAPPSPHHPRPQQPLPGPGSGSRGAERRLRASPQPLGGGSRKSRALVSPHLQNELAGRVGSRGRAERARRRERSGGVEGPGPRLPPGPKALLLPNSRTSRKT